ncbi:MAG: nucleoside permease [Candidatus Hydrogenedentota bacterium]
MNMTTRTQLSVMMFLEFFVWGAWVVTMGTYLGQGLNFSGDQIALAYTSTAWAAIISPFFVGMIADRFFQAQNVMAVLHLIGAVLMFYVTTLTDPYVYFIVLLAYAICYMPTLALVNAIAFNQMEDSEKEFPTVRVFGTLGWIIAGLLISFVLARFWGEIETTHWPLRMAAGASAVLGIYSFTLPKTPPRAAGQKVGVRDVLGLDALALMKERSFAIFVIASLLICIPLAFYYSFTNLFLNESGMTQVAAKMSLGQVSEVVFMIIMPFLFVRLGVKKMMLLGMGAWALRYLLFAYGNVDSLVWMFYGGILLHGICYDFFFVTGQIYVDNVAPREVRANAQGLIALVTYGAGMVIGNFVAGIIVNNGAIMEDGKVVDHAWTTIWLWPMGMAIVVIVFFALLFKEPKKIEPEIPTPPEAEITPAGE